jgi:hypothetical protein
MHRRGGWTMATRLFRVLLSASCAIAPACAVDSAWSVPSTAGFWYESRSLTLPDDLAVQLGGPLSPGEFTTIEQLSRQEVERAFSSLNVDITSNRKAFWKVQVLQTIRPRGPLPSAGESIALGPFGGLGSVDFGLVARRAVLFAPQQATRDVIITGIGRGIGRVAVHELTHQMVGLSGAHNKHDAGSYEYPSPDRAAQYYGDLHWSTARPHLERKFGRRRE